MYRLRFTLAQSMAIVLYVGFGFAALRNANESWASATFTLAFLMVSIATLGSLARKGRARWTWAGFAVLGWSRFLIGALPLGDSGVFAGVLDRIPSPGLLSELGFKLVLPYLSRPTGFIVPYYAQVFISLEIILCGFIGAIVGRLIAEKDKRPNS